MIGILQKASGEVGACSAEGRCGDKIFLAGMRELKIKILGNGGGINNGLPYNSFLVNDSYLIESPPDIMSSLYRENIDLSQIKVIFISHFHGDHYFGLPFIFLRIFFNLSGENINQKMKIVGPRYIENMAKEICGLSFGRDHPYIKWIENNIQFHEISDDALSFRDDEISFQFFKLYHSIETWGFSIYYNGEISFSYFPDTVWNDDLVEQIKLHPKIIIADMNGERTDPVQVHLSEDDIFDKAIKPGDNKTIFYGTHLKYQKKSKNKNIKYAYPGEIIEL
jgi:hypothetical protein